MPVATIASAVSRMSFSLTSQPNLFQLFQPMGGVRASPSPATAGGAPAPRSTAAATTVFSRIVRMLSLPLAPARV